MFIGAVIGLSFVLLLAAFRAPFVAVKAGVMNLLSILVPAVMQLAGERAWWTPRWLGRLLPERRAEVPEAASAG